MIFILVLADPWGDNHDFQNFKDYNLEFCIAKLHWKSKNYSQNVLKKQKQNNVLGYFLPKNKSTPIFSASSVVFQYGLVLKWTSQACLPSSIQSSRVEVSQMYRSTQWPGRENSQQWPLGVLFKKWNFTNPDSARTLRIKAFSPFSNSQSSTFKFSYNVFDTSWLFLCGFMCECLDKKVETLCLPYLSV